MKKKPVVKKKEKRSSAEKRIIVAEKKQAVNKAFKSKTRTAMRIFEDNLKLGHQDNLESALRSVYSLMDKGVKRGVFTRNKAARVKAQVYSRKEKSCVVSS
ncbi:30S ribosomal protein S20 [Candidatus Clavichlamydia salmonicola]|uniref:30S ribosomal protein S20 n=1 Tax=Candidatus Clavichlamydia salmonicola TaxID=469812 RepID=UPI001891ECC7|nr:30S ribosomal protein S20 [Candidatus Clavichlamydia salmonicola]MBF5050624.1 30S ribosomal protein S20 [Candidatus Clavichlamydia salmonicola]